MRDGDYTIYLIEFWSQERWASPSFDHFGCPPVTGVATCWLPEQHPNNWEMGYQDKTPPGTKVKHSSVANGFSASGDCWQQTGIHGTFDPDSGLEGVVAMSKHYPKYTWRLVKTVITQRTSQIAVMEKTK